MAGVIDIDTLDERNRWLDLNESMSKEGLMGHTHGEASSVAENLLNDSAVPHHHLERKVQDDLEDQLMIEVGR